MRWKPCTGSRTPEAVRRKPCTGSRTPEAVRRKPYAGSRAPEAVRRKPCAGSPGRAPDAHCLCRVSLRSLSTAVLKQLPDRQDTTPPPDIPAPPPTGEHQSQRRSPVSPSPPTDPLPQQPHPSLPPGLGCARAPAARLGASALAGLGPGDRAREASWRFCGPPASPHSVGLVPGPPPSRHSAGLAAGPPPSRHLVSLAPASPPSRRQGEWATWDSEFAHGRAGERWRTIQGHCCGREEVRAGANLLDPEQQSVRFCRA